MKILVTGATGFLGRNFCEVAESAGHHVFPLPHVLQEPDKLAGINWESIGGLVHFAAAGVRRTSVTRTWPDCLGVNFHGTRGLLFSLSASGCRPNVFVAGSIREVETFDRPDYWADPYIVSKKLEGIFFDEWREKYRGRAIRPHLQRCADDEAARGVARDVLNFLLQ